MVRVGRSLAIAGWIVAAFSAVDAYAQTVIVRNVPTGSAVEFVLNTTVVASGKADAEGLVTLTAAQNGLAERQQIDAQVLVDRCTDRLRVVIVDQSVAAPSADGCARQQVERLFRVQPISSLVIDGASTPPTVRLRQGRAPEAWLRPPAPGESVEGLGSTLPTGLMLFGGAGLGSIRDFSDLACGQVSGCATSDRTLALTGGVAYWFAPYVGAEASFFRPGRATASGSGNGFQFESELEGGLIALALKGGVPAGRARLTGTVGANYHRMTRTTAETIEPLTIVVDGVTQEIPGGSQTLQWRTEGWGLTYAGGAEVWLTDAIAFYGEAGRHFLKGDDTRGAETKMDDAETFILFGVRYRVF